MSVEPLKSLLRPELERLSAYRVPPAPPATKLDANESPWPLPGEAREQILRALRDIELHRYPDGRATGLREALARRFGGSADAYVIGSGSDEVIALFATAMSRPRPGAERPVVVFPEPTFVMYEKTNRAHGWQAVGVPLDDAWDLDVDAMGTTFERERPNLAYYATPNNPTGNRFSPERIERLVREFPQTLHVIDEAYDAFSSTAVDPWHAIYPQCATLGTLSKVGFAALRVGWARLDPSLAAEVDKVRQPFNVNALSQVVAELALTELAPLLATQAARIEAERNRMAEALAGHSGLTVYPSDANFFLVRFETDVGPIHERLLGYGIAVRRFGSGDRRLARCLRITVGTPEENDRLLEALDEIL